MAYNALDNAQQRLEGASERKLAAEVFRVKNEIGKRLDRVNFAKMRKPKRSG